MERSLAVLLLVTALALTGCVASAPTNDNLRHVPGEADLRPALF
jgi:hypothetical protein